MGGGVGGHTAASATARDERKGVAELSQGLASAAAAHCAASALHHGAQLFHHLLLHQWYDGWVTEPTRGFRNPRVGSVHAPRNPRTRTPWVRGSQSSEPTVFLEFHFPGLCWQTVLGFWCFRSFRRGSDLTCPFCTPRLACADAPSVEYTGNIEADKREAARVAVEVLRALLCAPCRALSRVV